MHSLEYSFFPVEECFVCKFCSVSEYSAVYHVHLLCLWVWAGFFTISFLSFLF